MRPTETKTQSQSVSQSLTKSQENGHQIQGSPIPRPTETKTQSQPVSQKPEEIPGKKMDVDGGKPPAKRREKDPEIAELRRDLKIMRERTEALAVQMAAIHAGQAAASQESILPEGILLLLAGQLQADYNRFVKFGYSGYAQNVRALAAHFSITLAEPAPNNKKKKRAGN